ncbi:MAG TPA: NADH-quinone oxidoreductase subunit G [Actinomycetaceae bacterium]|nr:NADH-quinone oxidoreductase subunit G [Actinomycetaceae bacterium]
MTTTENRTPVETVTVTIDGVQVDVPKGTLIIRAAEQAGIEIPRFCDHPLIKPAGACRQCLVEVATPDREGNVRKMPKPQTSCTMEVSPGMEVNTQRTSEVADTAQQGIMEFLLINHPLDCPVCDKGGECPLQNQALKYGRAKSRFIDVKRTFPKPIQLSTEILLDRDRCILCQRCTRFSSEIPGDAFIALQGRGGGHAGHEVHGLHGSQVGRFDEAVLDFANSDSEKVEPRTDPSLTGPSGNPAILSGLDSGPTGFAEQDTSGRPFASYFSGNTIQICPVGALTSATYRFRSRPFDLISVESIAEHDSSGAAIRIDQRRGVVLRRLSGNDPQVNEEWITDKDRFAFTWQTASDRLTMPLVRDENGELVLTSWSEALDIAARGLETAKEAGGVAVLPGGRLTLEDAYAYSAFARRVLGTNDIDARARVATWEEAGFLGTIAGTGLGVTFTDLENAPQVLLVGLEAEEEAGNVFLRLRKGVIAGKVKVATVAPFLTRGSIKMRADLIQAVPGTEAEVVRSIGETRQCKEIKDRLSEPGSVILIGERAATTTGAITAAVELAETTGARLQWIPRRAGERAALEAGCLPTLLPGGRPVTDPAARADTALVWAGAGIPAAPGRDLDGIIQALSGGELAGVVIGGVDIADLPDPAAARDALARTFVVSLEVRTSEITDAADVVLPVAPTVEKAGTFVNWEGRIRPFPQVLVSRQQPDRRVLNELAEEMGVDLELADLRDAVEQVMHFEGWTGARVAFERSRPGSAKTAGAGEAILATFKLMLDDGRLQDGEPHLAGTAHRAVARVSASTLDAIYAVPEDELTVTGPAGSITLPVLTTEMPDGVVWLPEFSPGSHVHEQLGARAGDVVRLDREAKK